MILLDMRLVIFELKRRDSFLVDDLTSSYHPYPLAVYTVPPLEHIFSRKGRCCAGFSRRYLEKV